MRLAISLFLFALLLSATDIVTVKSNNSVQETMNKIEKSLKEKNFYIFARVNHPKHIKENSKDNVDEESETILFDKPTGTKHMYTFSSAVMLEVPFKIAVYKNIEDEVFISYRSIDTIIRDHGMQECKFLDKGLRKALKTITEEASR